MWKLIGFIVVLGLLTVFPAATQTDAVVLQVAVPVFAEDFLEEAIAQYEAQNPGVIIELVGYQGGNDIPVQNSDDPVEYQDNLAQYFSSADVLFVGTSLDSEITRANYLLDLSPIMRSDPNFNPADFHNSVLRSFEWDGSQWALPVSTDFVVMNYQPALFDAAGLTYPNETWTFTDLDFAIRTLTQYDAEGQLAVPGISVGGNNALRHLLVNLYGRGVYDDLSFPNAPDFSDPQLETLLDAWYVLNDEGLLSLAQGESVDEVPMFIGSPLVAGGAFAFGPQGGPVGNNQTDAQWATALLPGGGAGLNPIGFAVSNGTQYPEMAYDLLTYLVRNPDVITLSGGITPALVNAERAENEPGQGGPGGRLGPAGFLSMPASFAPLLDTALVNATPFGEMRYAEGLVDALTLMQSDGLDARSALDEAEMAIEARLVVADERFFMPITVQAAQGTRELAEGEVALSFALLAGGRGAFALEGQFEEAAVQFIEQDAVVGRISFEVEPPNNLEAVTSNYDCFYAGNSIVSDIDLNLLLSLDPLLSVDPNYDPADFVTGTLAEVQVDGQTWALPLYISPLVLRYDPDLFIASGALLPNAEWTVSEFEDALRTLISATEDGTAPLTLSVSGQSALLTLIAAYGGLPFDLSTDPVTLNFTDPVTMAAMEQVLNLVMEGYISYGGGVVAIGAAAAGADAPIYSNIVSTFGFGGGGGGNNDTTDGYMTFPRGEQFNVMPFDMGTAYISANTEHVDACYRFIHYIAASNDLFGAMPARLSQINSEDLALAQGTETVAFYNGLANRLAEPTTITVPTNVNAGNLGLTFALFEVFERYLAGEVVDFETELRMAEQITVDYLACIDTLDFDNSEGLTLRQQIVACQASVNPT